MHARSASAPQTTEESETVFVRFVRALPAFWLVGTVIIAIYVFARSISLWLTVKRERPITDQEILDLLEDCKMQMGVQTILGVIVSDRIKSPALFGFIRPRLLLPQGMLEKYGLEELRYVFIHELAHLKQRDIYFGWLMALLQVVHWFNPLMWFAFGRMRADRELACDRLAISMMDADEPHKYGRTIVSLLESFSQVRYLPSVAGILEDTCQIERRIKMIADYKKTSRPRWAGAVLLIVILACVVLTNAYVAKADFAFGESVRLETVIPVIDPAFHSIDCFSCDGLEIYIDSKGPDGHGGFDLCVIKRMSEDEVWGLPENLGLIVNSSEDDALACISADGLTLYFNSNRSGGYGSYDIYMTTRMTKNDPWGPPMNLGAKVNSSADDFGPWISANGLELYYASSRLDGYGDFDIWITSRETIHDSWNDPVNLGPVVNSPNEDGGLSTSANGLALFFYSNRPGGYGLTDLYVAMRATVSDSWGEPVNLGLKLNGPGDDAYPRLSPDGHTLYFWTIRDGTYQNSLASILPIVDFNSDGNIDTDDLLILIGCWGQNEPLCDIGPTPFGDGIVDMKDLEVFMSYWEQANMPEIPED